jgi:solute carrier family 35 protein E1
MPLLPTTVGSAQQRACGTGSLRAGLLSNLKRLDIPLFLCFAVWYYGNYEHNITNKRALQALGGAEGFPLTIATCQLGVGVLYCVFLWAVPDGRPKPTITVEDWKAVLPLSFVTACAHAASVFALSAGALSFSQIVKSCEPAFAALIGTLLYKANVSTARWWCLVPIIGGVALSACVELDFAWAALVAATIANTAAAIRSNENKKMLDTVGIKDRLGSVGNQYAITTINAFFMLVPLALFREGHKLSQFIELCSSNKEVFWNVVLSGWWFYIYNEVATIIILKTSAVTQSIANTAKRAVIIVLGAIVMGESLGRVKLIGCAVAIGGVFLYSQIDDLVKRRAGRIVVNASTTAADSRTSVDPMVFVTPEKAKLHKEVDSVSTADCSPCTGIPGSDSSGSPQRNLGMEEVHFMAECATTRKEPPRQSLNGGA